MHRRQLLFALLATCSILACSLANGPTAPVPDVSTIVAGTLHAMTTPPSAGAPTQTTPAGNPIACAGTSLVIPPGLASGATCENMPAVDEQSGAPWDVAPAYTRITLQGYLLQGKFFQPQIMIYPAQEYASVNGGAANSITRLQAILASPTASISNDALPRLPWANAEQIIGAQIKIVAFNGGSGVRLLAEYAQYNAPINNHELFYHFEGLASDGKFYVVGTLPINAAFLAAESEPASPVPADGIPFPGISVSDPTVWANYYQSVTSKLNATSADAFQPTLTALDAAFQSLQVSQ